MNPMSMIKIGYFFEDVAHENFIKALATRIAREHGLTVGGDTLCEGGGSTIVSRFRDYMNDWENNRPPSLEFDLLVIVRDCNREGCEKRKKQFSDVIKRCKYPFDRVCFALADPNTERWYLTDPRGFREAIGGHVAPETLPYVPCSKEKGYYRRKLMEVLRKNDASTELGGAEYGGEIANHFDIASLPDGCDDNLENFIDCLRRVSQALSRST